MSREAGPREREKEDEDNVKERRYGDWYGSEIRSNDQMMRIKK